VNSAISRASSRESVWPGYLVPAASYTAAPVRGTAHVRLLVILGVVLVVIAAAIAVLAGAITPTPPRYVCPPHCGRPPVGTPVHTNPRFTAGDGTFSVAYPGPETNFKAKMDPTGVRLTFVAGDGGTMRFFGEPATNRSPQQIADDVVKKTFPDAVTAYRLPNAMLGYQPGYGEYADVFPQDSSGTYTRIRLVVIVAVRNGTALIAAANGPYHQFSQDFGPGPQSAADLELALDMDQYVNSFRWRGDPPR
jgi:hypothetical protein